VTISIHGWAGAAFAAGILIPALIAALAGGYILGKFILGHAGKTVLGIHIRHLFTRMAPSKFFDADFIDDRMFVEKVVRGMIEKGQVRG
jgi:hypothetical protein